MYNSICRGELKKHDKKIKNFILPQKAYFYNFLILIIVNVLTIIHVVKFLVKVH